MIPKHLINIKHLFFLLLLLSLNINVSFSQESKGDLQGNQSTSDNATENETVPAISATVELGTRSVSRGRVLWLGTASLGDLLPHTHYRIKLTIKNKSASDFAFSNTGTGCKCRAFRISDNLIPSGGEVTAEMVFKTPEQSMQSSHQVVVEFKNDNKTVGSIRCVGTLTGMLAFDRKDLHIEYSAIKKGVVKIPFFFSPPIKFSDLQPSRDSKLEEFIVVDVEQLDESHGLLILKLKQDSIDDKALTSIFGNIKLKDKVLPVEQTISVVLSKQEFIRISPALIRFHADESETVAIATSIVRIGNAVAVDASTEILATLDGQTLKLEKKALTQRIFRVSVSADKAWLAKTDSNLSVDWLVSSGSKQYRSTTIWELVDSK